jgi:hypothetical protein
MATMDLPFLKKGAKVNLHVIKGQIQIRHDLKVDNILDSTDPKNEIPIWNHICYFKLKVPRLISEGVFTLVPPSKQCAKSLSSSFSI